MLKILPLLIGALMAGDLLTPLPAAITYETLGGSLEDYQPVVDPRTDLPAKAGNTTRLLAAQTSRVLPRAWVEFSAVSGDPPVLEDYETVWGPAPSPGPTVTRIEPNAGDYLVTFPSSVSVQGQSIAVVLRFVMPQTTKLGGTVHAELLSPTEVRVRFRADGAVVTSDPGPNELITLMVR